MNDDIYNVGYPFTLQWVIIPILTCRKHDSNLLTRHHSLCLSLKVVLMLLLLQRCSWRCNGCQHRSPRSAQDRIHSRWPCPWHPGVHQGTGQVSETAVYGSFCQPDVSLMTFWLPLLSSYEEARHCYPIFCLRWSIRFPHLHTSSIPVLDWPWPFFAGVRPTFAPLQPTATSQCTSNWWKPCALSTRSTWSRWGVGPASSV